MSRHLNAGRKLSRNTGHRKALLRNLIRSVILSESIRTTTAKAKETKRVVEKLVTKARVGTLAARRLVHRTVRDQAALAKLFDTIAPRFKERPGGYTRLIHLQNRPGDNAPMALLEFVEKTPKGEEPKEPAEKKGEKKADKKSEKKGEKKSAPKQAKTKAAEGGGDQGAAETAEKKAPKQKKAKKSDEEK
jgi:large subunit ribosomal protein L17